MTHSKKIFRNSLFSIFNKVMIIVLAFVTRKLFIDFLSAELLGLNSLFADLLGLLNLADMGLGVAVQFQLYKPIADKDYEQIARVLNAAKKLYNIIGVAMIIAGVVLSFFIQYLIRENPYELNFLRIVFIINVASSASSYFFVHKRLYLQASEDLHISYFIDTIVHIVGSVLRIVAIVAFKDYYLFVILTAVQAIVSNVIVAVYCDKRNPEIKKIKGYTKNEMSTLLSHIKQLIPNKISAYIFSNTDNTILSAVLGLSAVTLFTNYNGVVLQLFTLAAMLSGIIRSSFGNVIQENSDKENHIFLLNGYQYLQFLYSSFCGVALFCLIDDFVLLWYGEEFVAPFVFVILITFDFFLHSMYLPLSTMLEVLGEFKDLKRQEVFAMIVNLVVSVGFVFSFGIIGPILGTLVVDIFTTIFRIITVIRKNYREYLKVYVKKYLVYIAVFLSEYVGIFVLFKAINLPVNLATLLLKGVICTVVVLFANLLIFRKTPEFGYIKDRFFDLIKRG